MTTDEVKENEARIRELERTPPTVMQSARKTRFLNGLLYVAVVVAIVCSVGVAVVYNRQGSAALKQAQANQATQVAVCLQGNQARTQIKTLWQYIIDTSKKNNPHPTPQQAALLLDFQKRVDAAYALRDCNHPGQ